MVAQEGFEPSVFTPWVVDLQSTAFCRSATAPWKRGFWIGFITNYFLLMFVSSPTRPSSDGDKIDWDAGSRTLWSSELRCRRFEYQPDMTHRPSTGIEPVSIVPKIVDTARIELASPECKSGVLIHWTIGPFKLAPRTRLELVNSWVKIRVASPFTKPRHKLVVTGKVEFP